LILFGQDRVVQQLQVETVEDNSKVFASGTAEAKATAKADPSLRFGMTIR
jgi:hypothetical protein